MFYYLSKVVWFVVQPSGLLLILVVGAAVLAFTRFQQLARAFAVAAAVLFIVGGLMPLSTWLTLPLEERFSRPELSGAPVAGIIVLGGMEDARVASARGVHGLNEAGERLSEAAALARKFPDAKLVITSSPPQEDGKRKSGAEAGAEILEDMGIDPDRLILEKGSRNTWQNAVNTRALLNPKPTERWLMITSASHMPRSIGAFRKVGFAVEPWPVDYRTAGSGDAARLFGSPVEGLRRLDMAVHEWLGLFAYWLTGRSHELLPGPG